MTPTTNNLLQIFGSKDFKLQVGILQLLKIASNRLYVRTLTDVRTSRYYSSLLIGNSQNDQQQQGQPIRSGRGQQGGSQQKSSNTICQVFDLEFLAEAFNIDKETRQMLKCESGQRGHIVMVERGLSENIDHISKADFYNLQAGHYTHLNSFKFPILKLLQLGAECGVLSSRVNKLLIERRNWDGTGRETNQDRQVEEERRRVLKRDHNARPVIGVQIRVRPGRCRLAQVILSLMYKYYPHLKIIKMVTPTGMPKGHSGIVMEEAKTNERWRETVKDMSNWSEGNWTSKGEGELKANADFTEYEAEALEALKSKLKGIIEKGVTFGNKQVVSA
ncbi:11S globulin seed storage protein G3-like protein [Tanacetum coccineum]